MHGTRRVKSFLTSNNRYYAIVITQFWKVELIMVAKLTRYLFDFPLSKLNVGVWNQMKAQSETNSGLDKSTSQWHQ